jgi:TatD family-associated radical SAM protein
MDWTYHYGDPTRLYLNVTNRCTNRCGFCVRAGAAGLGDGLLWGGPEPTLNELLRAIDERHPGPLRELIWCGFGEPTWRLDLITEAAPTLRRRAESIRLNTNGHACLIHGRDVLPALAAAVDEVSVSLNAPDRERYLELCLPDPTMFDRWPPHSDHGTASDLDRPHPDHEPPPLGVFWDAMIDFLTRAPRHFRRVQASVVGAVLTNPEIDAARELARSLGVERFRVR